MYALYSAVPSFVLFPFFSPEGPLSLSSLLSLSFAVNITLPLCLCRSASPTSCFPRNISGCLGSLFLRDGRRDLRRRRLSYRHPAAPAAGPELVSA
ncbi:hypothetical protein C8J56DRAFT_66608 [Mycena floridula]|nr:hypothetical protein C8J56DRAFT_66608 [Mycena floridula]